MPCNQFPIELRSFFRPLGRSVATGHQNSLRARLHCIQRLQAASIQNAGVIESGHDTEQRVQSADFFRTSFRASITQSRQAQFDHMRKIIRGFSSRAANSITDFRDSPVSKNLRLAGVRQSCYGTGYSSDLFRIAGDRYARPQLRGAR